MNLAELRYIISGEDNLSTKFRTITGSSERAEHALKNNYNSVQNLKKGFSDLSAEVPGFERLMSLVTNPYLLGGAALAGIGMSLKNISDVGNEFNSQFRELQNLNLDKTTSEIASLKRELLDLSYNKGFDPGKVVTGYFDIESITGKYGNEVTQIVSKQGEFAKLFKADFNAYIEGTGKAMANYGFGADKLDDFNRSAYATYKTAKINFDELSKVQAVYAGSAASAKQNFDTANKLMAIFTLKTKSSEEASTLTKTAFQDLTKPATIKAFQKIGISMFEANGQIKQADKLILELNSKFRNTKGDKGIVALKNQFQGSEGLIAMIQAATDKSGSLQNTLDGFDKTKLGLNKALDAAKNDVNYINEQLGNKIKTLKIQIDADMQPIKKQWLEFESKIISGVKDMMGGGFHFSLFGRSIINNVGEGNKQNQYNEGQTNILSKYGDFTSNLDKMNKTDFEKNQAKIVADYLNMKSVYSNKPTDDELLKKYRQGQLDALKEMTEKMPGRWSDATNSGKNIAKTQKLKGNTDPTLDAGLNGISGGGSQVKNVTVNITKLIEKQIIQSANLTEAAGSIQAQVEEALIRAISGAEQVLAN